MAVCSYLYASGLRIESGHAVVELDGKKYRVVRNGKGASRLDRKSDNPVSDGEITLKDLQKKLDTLGRSSIIANVQTPDGAFPVTLEPAAAMGATGRKGDHSAALKSLFPDEARAAALYQLRTLPDSLSSDQEGVAERRLKEALSYLSKEDLKENFGHGFWTVALENPQVSWSTMNAVLEQHPDLLTDDQLEMIVTRQPALAVRHAYSRLSKEQRDRLLADTSDTGYRAAANALVEIAAADLSQADLEKVLAHADESSYLGNVPYSRLPEPLRNELVADALLKHYPDELTTDQVSSLFQADAARVIANAPQRLSNEQLAIAAVQHSADAITHAADYLDKEQLKIASNGNELAVLRSAAHRFSPEELEGIALAALSSSPKDALDCIMNCPDTVLQSSAVSSALARAAKAHPEEALSSVAGLLEDHLLDSLFSDHPYDALRTAREFATSERLDQIVHRSPAAAVKLAADLLEQSHIEYLINEHPSLAVTKFAEHFPQEKFDLFFAANPVDAYKAAPQLCSEFQVGYLLKNHPDVALDSGSLTHEQRVEALRNSSSAGYKTDIELVKDRATFDVLVEVAPMEAFKQHPEKFSEAQLDKLLELPIDEILNDASSEGVAVLANRAFDKAPRAFCSRAPGALSKEQRKAVLTSDPDFAGVVLRDSLTNEEFAIVFEQEPERAVRSILSSRRSLATPEVLDKVIDTPAAWSALEMFPERFSPAQVERVAEVAPDRALRHMRDRLSPERMTRLKESQPGVVLQEAPDEFSVKEFKELCRKFPENAKHVNMKRVSDEQVPVLFEAAPVTVLQSGKAHLLSEKQIKEALENHYWATVEHAWKHIPERRRRRLLRENTRTLLEEVGRNLSHEEILEAIDHDPVAVHQTPAAFDRLSHQEQRVLWMIVQKNMDDEADWSTHR